MKAYDAKNIRNIALTGHAGSGKTTFAESLLFAAKSISRKGTVEDGNTISDFHDLEHEKTSSVFGTPLFVEYKDTKINILDSPGYDDYIGETVACINAADTVIVFVNAQNGFEVGSEIAVTNAERLSRQMMFAISKLDNEVASYEESVQEIKDIVGNSATIFQYPANPGAGFNSIIDVLTMKQYTFADDGSVSESDVPDSEKEIAENYRNELVESVAESDEDLMNLYFDEGDLPEDKLAAGLKQAIINRQIYPIICVNPKNGTGTHNLLDFAVTELPSPNELPTIVDEGSVKVTCDENSKTSLFIFKMFSDPKLGDMTYFKVKSGKISSGMDLVNETRNSNERFGQIFVVNGKRREEIDVLKAGDIGATVKLKNSHINDTLHEKGFDAKFPALKLPNPKVRIAIVPVTKGEEEKVGLALNNLHEEDPSLIIEHSQELRQTILYAQGELHLAATKWRLENRYRVMAKFIEPRVPYRETIQKSHKASYRHKKQSGGAGQFAEVHMMVEPYAEDAPYSTEVNVRGKELHNLNWGGTLEFVNCIVGGVIDQRFMPAILKGVMEKMEFGPLTGSYARDIRVYIYDGKMHPVDSNEAAFKMAGTQAFKECFQNAGPKILEPVYDVEVKVPEEFVGDIMSDLPSRRGIILGIDSEGRYQKIKTRLPLSELDKYATALRSMTQARATYTSSFSQYESVPANVQQELIDAYKKSQEEED